MVNGGEWLSSMGKTKLKEEKDLGGEEDKVSGLSITKVERCKGAQTM